MEAFCIFKKDSYARQNTAVHKNIYFINLRFINRLADIMPHILIIKFNPLRGLISIGSGCLQILPGCRDSQHAAAICHDIAVSVKFRTCVENIVTVFFLEIFKALYLEAFLVFNRIAVGSQDDTDSRIVLKFQFNLIQRSVHTGFKHIPLKVLPSAFIASTVA